MNKKKMFCGLALSLVCICKAADTGAWPIATTDEAVTGAWMNNFAAATNLAWTTKAPLVLVWGNYGCDWCAELEDAINSEQFVQWRTAHQDYVYCFVFGSGVSGEDVAPNENSGAKDFIATGGGTRKKISGYPFVCLWWPMRDGTTRAVNFVGRSGSMGVSASGKNLAQQLEAAIEIVFDGYVPCRGPDVFSFTVSDGDYDRLEAEPNTGYVDVPLSRELNDGGMVTNRLVATWPDAILPTSTNDVVWGTVETQKFVRVSLERGGTTFPAGKSMTLTLFENNGEQIGASAIHFVEEQPCSVVNPKFVGDDFDYGEWTMDYEAAKAKGGYVLANFSGVLWCPYCHGIETSLLASQEFKTWAVSNKVSLVLFDQSQASSPATAAGSGLARLLSYEAGNSSVLGGMASGASYLSRKQISQAAAVGRIAMTTKYTAQWLAPGSTAARLGNPTLLLVKGDKVVGRFSASRNSDKFYDPVENVARLSELLRLAQRTGEADDFVQTTTRILAVGGTTNSAAFQINDRNECFRLTGLATGTLTVSASATRDVTLEITTNGVAVASGVNSVSLKLRKAHLATELALRAVGAMPELVAGSSSAFTGSLSASFVPDDGSEDVAATAKFHSSTVLGNFDVEGAKSVTAKKTSGTLPAGMKLKVDKATGRVVVEGTPKKPGTYKFSYTVTVKTSAGKTVSEPQVVTLVVGNPTTGNRYVGAKWKAAVPLIGKNAGGKAVLVGVVELSIAATGRITAKRTGLDGKKVSYSGAWSAFDGETGTAVAVLEKKGGVLKVALLANGEVLVNVDGMEGSASLAGDISRFDGYYTVTLPVVSTTARYACKGTGYLLVTLKKGKATVKGMLSNGTTVSLTTMFAMDPKHGDYAIVPVLRRTAKDTLGVLLRIQANGASLYASDQTVRVARLPSGVAATWNHHASGDEFNAELEVYGGYFPKGKDVDEWLALFDLVTISPVIDGAVTEVRYTYAKATGLVRGTAKNVTLSDGTVVSGRFTAALLPGWIDCGCAEEEFPGQFIERPFASGTFLYKIRSNGKSVTVSVPFDLIAR